MTFRKRLREYLKEKGHTIPFITCSNCGGSYGTLVKTGDTYTHMRPMDCELHRRVEAKKANIMAQAKPLVVAKQEERV